MDNTCLKKWFFCNPFIILLLMVFLSSCSHVRKQDGPPNFYVDVSKIPNATPKPERLSKYGNMPYYNVFGKRYYTLKSSQHFEQVGIASWYGTKFHDRRTSSGEPYNMLAMTAAHKTLPLPTYVEVMNLKNHKKIIVKVNDRGPFASNRIIDLSYVAARKLDIVGNGTAYVKIKAIDPYRFNQSYYLMADQTPKRQRTYTDYLAANKPIAKLRKASHLIGQKPPKKLYAKRNRHARRYLEVGALRKKPNVIQSKHRKI